ncbi:MAG TPA: hypothetical protein VEK07_09575 [Polyangiaceae bacterium]|nr:hypothetical protein [Polyangiaceae bacterium]
MQERAMIEQGYVVLRRALLDQIKESGPLECAAVFYVHRTATEAFKMIQRRATIFDDWALWCVPPSGDFSQVPGHDPSKIRMTISAGQTNVQMWITEEQLRSDVAPELN